jgi:hypothetical protein
VLPSRNVVSTIRISSINVQCYCGTLPANNNKRNAIRNVPVVARNCFLTDPLAGEYVNAKAQLARPLKKEVSHVSSPSVLTGKMQVFVERQGRVLVLTDAGPGTILGELARGLRDRAIGFGAREREIRGFAMECRGFSQSTSWRSLSVAADIQRIAAHRHRERAVADRVTHPVATRRKKRLIGQPMWPTWQPPMFSLDTGERAL